MSDSKKRASHGGPRKGAGRKPVKHPKKPIGTAVDYETREKIKFLAKKHNVTQALVVETAVKRLTTLD